LLIDLETARALGLTKTGNWRVVQLLFGAHKLESTVRYRGIAGTLE
jgi:hypothetical protein